ncbi:MAG: hypothetical protein ACSLFR_14625 [Solirubrobacteraceae bacterium]
MRTWPSGLTGLQWVVDACTVVLAASSSLINLTGLLRGNEERCSRRSWRGARPAREGVPEAA